MRIGRVSAEHEVPIERIDQGLHFVRVGSRGVDATHQAAHTGAGDQVDGYAVLFEPSNNADVRPNLRDFITRIVMGVIRLKQ